MKQRLLPFHGGPRPNSGRPKGNRTSHAARPRFERTKAVHVTMRMRGHVWHLRSQRCFRLIRACLERARGRFRLRIIEFSVQGNHLHLIVEADGSEALSRGMQGLAIRIAKALNALMERAGRVFDDHYFSRLLETPTELVRAIRYVLQNHAHHFGERGVDPFSSAALPEVVELPVSWLFRFGVRRVDSDIRLRWAEG